MKPKTSGHDSHEHIPSHGEDWAPRGARKRARGTPCPPLNHACLLHRARMLSLQCQGALLEGNPAPALKAARQKLEVAHSRLFFRTLAQRKIPAQLKKKKQFTIQNTEELPNKVVPEAMMERYSILLTVQHPSHGTASIPHLPRVGDAGC